MDICEKGGKCFQDFRILTPFSLKLQQFFFLQTLQNTDLFTAFNRIDVHPIDSADPFDLENMKMF